MDTTTDLFQHPELLPSSVQKILNDLGDWDATYPNCQALENTLRPLGYTFEWGLDAIPYNLTRIKN